MVRCRRPAQTFPAALVAKALCGSRSMVHMRMVNSVAMLDRGDGMVRPGVFRAAADGKLHGNNLGRAGGTLVMIRRLVFAVLALLSVSGTASYAQSGPFTGLAGSWSGGAWTDLRCDAPVAIGRPRRERT